MERKLSAVDGERCQQTHRGARCLNWAEAGTGFCERHWQPAAAPDPYAGLRALSPNHPSLRNRYQRYSGRALGSKRVSVTTAVAGLAAVVVPLLAVLGFSPSYLGSVGLVAVVFAVLSLGEGR